MTKEGYYTAIRELVPTYGEMPLSYRKELTEMLRKNPKTKIEPATDNELGAILNYLNHRCMEVDLLCGNPGFVRYKDAVLCVNYEHTEWILLERRPDEQLWDLWNYLLNLNHDEHDLDLSNIYSVK